MLYFTHKQEEIHKQKQRNLHFWQSIVDIVYLFSFKDIHILCWLLDIDGKPTKETFAHRFHFQLSYQSKKKKKHANQAITPEFVLPELNRVIVKTSILVPLFSQHQSSLNAPN